MNIILQYKTKENIIKKIKFDDLIDLTDMYLRLDRFLLDRSIYRDQIISIKEEGK